jgi:hypothetical protein
MKSLLPKKTCVKISFRIATLKLSLATTRTMRIARKASVPFNIISKWVKLILHYRKQQFLLDSLFSSTISPHLSESLAFTWKTSMFIKSIGVWDMERSS